MTQIEDKNPALQKVSFESSLDQLQKAVKKLEGGELSLEDSLRQFEEGVRLTRVCQEYLSTAEQRVDLLMKATETQVDVQPFTPSTGRS
jgi:exodeoxyribonuclease VII small subunit